MVTAALMRKLALSLPEVEEKSHFEKPDFRVRNKIFAGLSQDGTQGNLKLTPESQALALSGKPEAFTPAAGARGRAGWTLFELALVGPGELRELLLEAHSFVFKQPAPKKPSAAKAPTKKKPRAPARQVKSATTARTRRPS